MTYSKGLPHIHTYLLICVQNLLWQTRLAMHLITAFWHIPDIEHGSSGCFRTLLAPILSPSLITRPINKDDA